MAVIGDINFSLNFYSTLKTKLLSTVTIITSLSYNRAHRPNRLLKDRAVKLNN